MKQNIEKKNKKFKEELQKEGEIEMEAKKLMSFIKTEGYKEGKIEGKIEGKVEGEVIGVTIGKELGKKEGIIEITISNVKKMYNKNFSVQNISEILELDFAFVQKVISGLQPN